MNELRVVQPRQARSRATMERILVAVEELLAEKPERALEQAVKGMLPRNPLGRKMYSKLKVFAGPEHPHQAQQPKPLDIGA